MFDNGVHRTWHFSSSLTPKQGRNISGGRPSARKARRNTDSGSSPRCDKGFFSQSQLPVQTLLGRCLQSHALASLRTLTNSNTGSHTIVWTHGLKPCTHCSCDCCSFTQVGDPNLSQESWDNEVLNRKQLACRVLSSRTKRN